MKAKILLVMEGGVLQNIVTTNPESEIAIIDYDGDGDGNPVVYISKSEIVDNMSKAFRGDLSKKEIFVVNQLKELGFLTT